MAYNGSGVFARLYNWVNDAAGAINIRADRMDNETQGIADGLSNAICKDGQTTTTAPIPFAQGIIGPGGTLTLPAGADTLVARTSTDTLTNKSLTSATLTGTTTIPGSGQLTSAGALLLGSDLKTAGSKSLIRYTGATSVANGGTTDLNINAGGGGWPGILIVTQGTHGSFAFMTGTVFGIAGRVTQFASASLATVNGSSGGSTFTLTCPSDGTIRITNTSGAVTDVDIVFFGGTLT